MNAERKQTIKGKLIEEFYWGGKMVVYVDSVLTQDTFDEAVAKIGEET